MIKTKSFKSKDLENLGIQLADWQNSNPKVEPKGSIPFFNTHTLEYCLLSFYTGEEEPRESKEDAKSKTGGSSQPSSNSTEITPGQVIGLRKMGYPELLIDEMSKQEAWEIINKGIIYKKPTKESPKRYSNTPKKEYKESKDKYPETYL
jgi:hypothetical protein